MRMSSDLGKMYRRNYMVKSQLRSLAEKSKALNAKIDGDTKIDEWAESYITRADAQIDDVSDYMNYRNLGRLSKGQGHIINYTIYEHAPTATPPGVPVPPPAPIAPPAPAPVPTPPPAPAPVPGGPNVSTTSLRFVETMPIELQVPFRRIDREHDFANNDNRIGTYDNTKLMKEIFRTNSGPHELGDGRVKWARLSQKYAEDNRVSHERLIQLMTTWKNTPVSVVIQNAPTKRQIDAAIMQSRKFADRPSDQEEIMAIAADPNYGAYSAFGNITDSLPLVTAGSTAGALLMLGGMGAIYGLVTYSEYKSQKKLSDSAKGRLKRMAIYGGVGVGIGSIYKAVVGTGQATGYY